MSRDRRCGTVCRGAENKGAEGPFIAITGTNGKSTTTALIAHVFGKLPGVMYNWAAISARRFCSLDEPARDKVYVVECSSYQIDLAPSLDPSVGIFLNLAPDHLDRHGNMANYAGIKKRLVDAPARLAVIGMDDALQS